MATAKSWISRELSGYTIVELIGSGSMADVFLARQPSMNRWVAIKILSSAFIHDAQFVARFRQEAQIVAALEHPHILPVIDYGEVEDTPYIVMRYISGGTLQDAIDRRPLPPPDVLRYLTEIGQGLDYAHSLGVVHRDVKPKNILLDTRSNSFITDFGLAKIVRGGGLTHSGVGMIGTPHYMSPEQGRGQPVDGRSDLYSLGVMLYEMLTGRVPFDADSAVGIVMRHINDPIPPVSQFNGGLPSTLDAIIARALAKNPADRFQSAHEMTDAVAESFGTSVIVGPVMTRPLSQIQPVELGWGVRLGNFLADVQDWFRQVPVRGRVLLGSLMALIVALGLWSAFTWAAPGAAGPTPTGSGAQATATIASAGVTAPPSPLPSETPPAEATSVAPTPAAPTLAPTPSPRPVVTEPPVTEVVAQIDGMTLVYIPAGEFPLGASENDPNARDDEKQNPPPPLPVYLDAYWIDKTEVTVAQFQDFLNATGYQTEAEQQRPGGNIYSADGRQFVASAYWFLPEGRGAPEALPRRPVVQVSWNDARAYCQWTGRDLPTEAQWDKAARGAQGRIFPWGNVFDGTQVSFCDGSCGASWHDTSVDDGFARTGDVGSYPEGASPYGVLDMSGNVWEWVLDWYDFRGYYRIIPENPTGPETGADKTVRGGSWIDTFDRVRASARDKFPPDERNNITGFRCATASVP
jgi:formylglycine-generating enzyme required for sulfatase activity